MTRQFTFSQSSKNFTYEQKLEKIKKRFKNTYCLKCQEYCDSTTSELKQCLTWKKYKSINI